MYELYIVFWTMPELVSDNACMSITVYYLLIVLLHKSFITRQWGSPHSCASTHYIIIVIVGTIIMMIVVTHVTDTVSTFKIRLKTFLYVKAYS